MKYCVEIEPRGQDPYYLLFDHQQEAEKFYQDHVDRRIPCALAYGQFWLMDSDLLVGTKEPEILYAYEPEPDGELIS